MSKCSKCDLDTWEEYDKCILHCPKNNYQDDSRDNTLLKFYNELKQYIVNQKKDEVLKLHKQDSEYTDNIILHDVVKNLESNKQLQDIFQKNIFIPNHIIFPHRDSKDSFDYLKLLNYFGQIHFNYCEFYSTYLELPNVEVFFQDCVFHNAWNLYDYNILDNVNNVIYQGALFHKKVSMSSSTEYDETFNKLSFPQFKYDCKFNEGIRLESIIISRPFFNSEDTNYIPDDANIKYIELLNCTIMERFILNYFSIEEFNIEKTIFKSKFEFKQNKIKSLNIDDSNFEKLADFFGSKFIKFKIYKSIFNKFVGFEKCEFGSSNIDKEYISNFEYVTFLDFTNFRNTKFKSGLNIENINLKEYPNFLNAEINHKNTNRETFRIIKQSFDKIGNTLEANLYFSSEMKKYREELSQKPLKGNSQKKFIFWINEKTSNFGQSFVLPIVWLIIFATIYGVIIYGNEQNWLKSISPNLSSALDIIMHCANRLVKNIQPLSKLLKENYEFVSLIFYIAFSVLIWQTIVAVKRHTKR